MVLLPFETSIPTALYILMCLLKMDLHGIQHSSLLIQSPGVSNGHVQGQSNLHKSNSCNDRLGDWLSGGHLVVQGENVTPMPEHYTA